MSNYKEIAVSGTAWLRCHSIGIQNPYNAPGSYGFAEETVLVIVGGATVTQPAGTLSGMYDGANMIEVVDAISGEPTGQFVTEEYLFQLIYSKYRQLAALRDEAEQGAPA